MVEDLSLRAWEARPGVTARIPLETGLSDMQAQDLAGAGLIPLQAAANTDKAYFTYVPSAHAPRRYADPGATQEAAMMALLPYQLYAGRVAAWLNRIAAQEAGAPDAQTLAARLKAHALELLATASGPAPESCVTTRVEDSPDHPDRYRVTLELRPPFKLFNLTPRLELTLELRK